MRQLFICCLFAAGITASAFQGDWQGMLAGQVVNQATGAPLKDAIVTLRYANPHGPAETMVVQTNEAGRFAFTELWGRDWELSAECSGFARGVYRATRYDPRGSFSLSKNQQIKDIVLKLSPQAVVTGRVVDAERKPVEGARVTLLKGGYAGGAPYWAEVASAETLDNGEYRIPRVVPGRYVVKAAIPRPEFARTRSELEVETGYAATYQPNVTDPALAAQVDITDGQEIRGADVQLVPARLFHVRGRLQSPVNWDVTGNVMLVDPKDPGKVIATLKTRPPDHLFDVERIPAGSYLAYGRLDASIGYYVLQAIEVADRNVDGLVLRLGRQEAISGELRAKPEDRPVNLRKISLHVPFVLAGPGPEYRWAPLTVKDDLTFRVSTDLGTPYARFKVQVSDLPEGCYVASIRYGDTEVPEEGIEYTPAAGLVITIGVDGGRVEGTVSGEDEKPVSGAVVGLFSGGEAGSRVTRSVQADAQGKFHFVAMPPGEYKLIAWDDVSRDDLENPEFVKRFAGKAAAISIPANGAVTAPLKIAGK